MEEKGEKHPPLRSQHQFYDCVFMDLLRRQKGCCAYTEIKLRGDEREYQPDKFKNGTYNGARSHEGELEHFAGSLKEEKAWLWDNLFVAHEKVNKSKPKSRDGDPILKPDTKEYDPDELLHYDLVTHQFTAKDREGRNPDEKERINQAIEDLKINLPLIVAERRKIISKLLNRISLGVANVETDQFFTAFEMAKSRGQNPAESQKLA